MSRRESAYDRASTRLGYDVRPAHLEEPMCEEKVEDMAASTVMTEHDYDSAPKTGMLCTSRLFCILCAKR